MYKEELPILIRTEIIMSLIEIAKKSRSKQVVSGSIEIVLELVNKRDIELLKDIKLNISNLEDYTQNCLDQKINTCS